MVQMVTPRTELDAVNNIIGAIGESRVNTLEGEPNVDVINARAILNIWSVQIQDRGWTFNVNESFQLVPDTFSGKIVWLPSYLRVTSPGGTPYVERDGFVWDRLGDTNQFTGRITVSMVQQVPFQELPLCFRQYVTALARKQFNNDYYGDPGIDMACDQIIARAEVSVNEYELDYGNYNLLSSDTFNSANLGR